MSIRFLNAFLAIAATAGLLIVAGCSQPKEDQPADGGDEAAAEAGHDDYNPHDVPITEEQKTELRAQTAKFADAVATVKELRNAIELETAGGIPENPYKAHQALDKADLVLQWFPEIARESEVPKDKWEEVNTSANDLRTLFEQVHQNIDNKKNPDFAAVAGPIDEKLVGLEAVANQ